MFAVGRLAMVGTLSSNSSQYIVLFAQSSFIVSGTNLILVDEDGDSIFSIRYMGGTHCYILLW